jgi:hypothetical protein
VVSELDKWESFYVIVGSAAGALIGLQFVVMTLIAQRPRLRAACFFCSRANGAKLFRLLVALGALTGDATG